MKLGDRIFVGDNWFEITKFLDEPDTGLCVIEETKGALKHSFTVPVALVRRAIELEKRVEAAQNALPGIALDFREMCKPGTLGALFVKTVDDVGAALIGELWMGDSDSKA